MTATAPKQQQENPLAEGLALRKTPDPCALVIFGASGDLTARKLLPALERLTSYGALPPEAALIGVARTPMSDEAFREYCREHDDDRARQQPRGELVPVQAR